jgi:hypothetical protein
MDATPLDSLMPSGGPSQSLPPLPSATTYTPVITPGTHTFSPPPPTRGASLPAPGVKTVLKNILTYISIFLGITIISMTQFQSLILRFVPHAYSSSGVLSMYGAGFLGILGVVIVYILQTLLQPLI